MRDGAVYVNTARAALHDLDALTEALSTRQALRQPASTTSTGSSSPRATRSSAMANVVLTPHIGGATYDTEVNHSTMLAEDVGPAPRRRDGRCTA